MDRMKKSLNYSVMMQPVSVQLPTSADSVTLLTLSVVLLRRPVAAAIDRSMSFARRPTAANPLQWHAAVDR